MFKRISILITLLLLSILAVAQNVTHYTYKINKEYPHSRASYTEGLFFNDGKLYESIGQYGESAFLQVNLEDGSAIKSTPFESKYFIEGSCILNGYLYILTWKHYTCFVYNPKTMVKMADFRNPREGWGMTTDGKSLIISDGSSNIYYHDPLTFMEQKKIKVKLNGKSVNNLNELEYIDGKIWANIYLTDFIVIIDPETGNVIGKIDCTGILSSSLRKRDTDVLNGIAYDPCKKKIYVTGKYWPKMYQISIVPEK